MSDERHISVYRVGILWALAFDWRALRRAGRYGGKTWYEVKMVAHFARTGNWRAARQSFDGWHAEHDYARVNCGTGWTRGRALADLRRQLGGV